MKNLKISSLLIALLVLATFTLISCEEEPVESCSLEEFCTNSVTTCCTASSCVYKYGGKEYPESELDQLVDDLGCTAGGARVALEVREDLKAQLLAQISKARAGLR